MADLLGVAHGFQHRVIQGLQGGQDILIVPHVVHKVIWGRGSKGQGSLEHHAPPSVPLPHLHPSTHPSVSPPTEHLPHSSLVSTWLWRERRGLRSSPLQTHTHSPPLCGWQNALFFQLGWVNPSSGQVTFLVAGMRHSPPGGQSKEQSLYSACLSEPSHHHPTSSPLSKSA